MVCENYRAGGLLRLQQGPSVHEADYRQGKGSRVRSSLLYNSGRQSRQVVRFDCEHGHAHKHILYVKPAKKQDMSDLSYKDLFNLALDDIERNWRLYKRKYNQFVGADDEEKEED
jgi:hypothetical protein